MESNEGMLKRKKKKCLRRRSFTEDDDGESVLKRVMDMKSIQKLRERPKGVDIASIGLCQGQDSIKDVESIVVNKPQEVGGLIDMPSLKSKKVDEKKDAYEIGIGTQFSNETNKRDEDEEMVKYIEMELTKRKALESDGDVSETKYYTASEAALQSVPEHLRSTIKTRSEEMLSSQMLSGIPEVDLGIEVKIKNIEATEEAKLQLIKEKERKKDSPSQFVPTNMAVNFMHHNRFSLDDTESSIKEETSEILRRKRQFINNTVEQKATDDYHYEKFKKQFRRY